MKAVDLSGEENVESSAETKEEKIPLSEKMARFIAKYPWRFLISTLTIATAFSFIGIVGGKFEVAIDNEGWISRNTLIGDREMQTNLIKINRKELFNDEDGSVWYDLENNIQTGFIDVEDDSFERRRRNEELPSFLDGCEIDFYFSENFLTRDNVFSVWKTEPDKATTSVSTLDVDVVKQICEADAKTLAALEANNACKAECGDSKCLPGHSLSLVLHVYLGLDDLSCDALVEAYTNEVKEEFVAKLADCSNEIRESFDPVTKTWGEDLSCPPLFRSSLLASDFGLDGNLVNRYSTSYYNTFETVDEAFKIHDDFGFGDGILVQNSYGTLWDKFGDLHVDSLLTRDMVS